MRESGVSIGCYREERLKTYERLLKQERVKKTDILAARNLDVSFGHEQTRSSWSNVKVTPSIDIRSLVELSKILLNMGSLEVRSMTCIKTLL